MVQKNRSEGGCKKKNSPSRIPLLHLDHSTKAETGLEKRRGSERKSFLLEKEKEPPDVKGT